MSNRSFTIPTIYTAVDRMSPVIKKMEVNMGKFEARLNRTERTFNKLSPSIGNATKQLLSYASAGAAIGAIAFSGKAVMDFETAIAELGAVTGTEGKQLDLFKSKIFEVAKATKESSIEVAKAFTNVGNNTPALLADANALAEVSKQSIILAQAARLELGPSAEYLTSIMNQFDLPFMKAKRVGDLLSQGLVIGSQSIAGTAEALEKFGAVAKNAGIPIEDAIASIQIISGKLKDPEIAGRQLKQSFLRLEKLNILEPKALKMLKLAGVNMKIASDTSLPLVERLKELQKLLKVDGAVGEVFNSENVQAMIPLLQAADRFQGFKDKLVSGSENKMLEMAAKNTNTFWYALKQLKNEWVNYLTSSDRVNSGLETLKNLTNFVTNNLDSIVKWTTRLVAAFIAFKAILFAVRTGWVIYNAALALNVVLMGKSIFALRGSALALTYVSRMTTLAATAQSAYNVILLAAPYVAATAFVAGLAYTIYDLATNTDRLTEAQRVNNDLQNRVLSSSSDQLVRLGILFQTLRNSEQGTTAYTDALAKLEDIQPGIVENYSLQLKYLGDMNKAEKDLTASIIERVRVQSATDLAIERSRQSLERASGGPAITDYYKSLMTAMSGFGFFTPSEIQSEDAGRLSKESQMFSEIASGGSQKFEFSIDNNTPFPMRQKNTMNNDSNLTILIKNTNLIKQ